jgi:hypothetical protein
MGYVYLINIERTDLYKIGVTSKTVEKRMKSLQTGSAKKLICIERYESEIYQKIETILHRQLKPKKYIPEDFENLSGEWFLLSMKDVYKFKSTCQEIEEIIGYLKERSTLDITKIL